MADELAKGQQWRHKESGDLYRILAVANTRTDDAARAAKFAPTVVYVGSDGRVWARLMSQFVEAFERVKAPKIDYCPSCYCLVRSGEHTCTCVMQSDESKLANYDVLVSALNLARRQRREAWEARERWHGKHAMLRLENNALRKQMHKLRERLKELC